MVSLLSAFIKLSEKTLFLLLVSVDSCFQKLLTFSLRDIFVFFSFWNLKIIVGFLRQGNDYRKNIIDNKIIKKLHKKYGEK